MGKSFTFGHQRFSKLGEAWKHWFGDELPGPEQVKFDPSLYIEEAFEPYRQYIVDNKASELEALAHRLVGWPGRRTKKFYPGARLEMQKDYMRREALRTVQRMFNIIYIRKARATPGFLEDFLRLHP